MATHRESRAIAQPSTLLFDVVADVECYPEFLPLVREARILRRDPAAYETEQSLALGPLIHRFRTRTELDRPHAIRVLSRDPLFVRFDLRWQFTSVGENDSQVDFALDCETRSLFLLPVVQLLVLPMAAGMVSAFEARAHSLAADR
ncbi:MAG: type II toxin-antitoxin system RatA family toxin [Elusimicrobia bacterium]|nr:MAG: type II toxin-antitoxin system RatA family toxin [Elusimicrobiota bacterium]